MIINQCPGVSSGPLCPMTIPMLVSRVLVLLVVPEDGREASRVERRLVGVVISSVVVGRVVAVGWVVAVAGGVAGVVVAGSIQRVAVVAIVAKSEVFGLE